MNIATILVLMLAAFLAGFRLRSAFHHIDVALEEWEREDQR